MKKFAILVIGLLILFSLCACGSEANNKWNEIYVNEIIPAPESKNWKVFSNENDYLDINVFDTSLEEYESYISLCEDEGFEIYSNDNVNNNEYECSGVNKYHSNLYIVYDVERETMSIQLSAIIERNPLQWSNSNLAQMLPVPATTKGYIDADKEDKFEAVLMDVSINDFKSYVDSCIENGFVVDSKQYTTYYKAQNESGYQVTIEFAEKYREMGISIKVLDK